MVQIIREDLWSNVNIDCIDDIIDFLKKRSLFGCCLRLKN